MVVSDAFDIRAPFMVQWKGRIPAGVTVKSEWKLDGVNLLPYLTGEKSGTPHDALFGRFGQQIALRKGDWKLVKGTGSAGVAGVVRLARASTEGAELYKLSDDLGEQNNLAEENPETMQELAAV